MVATLLMTVMVFTFVLLIGDALKEILPLLINGQASLWNVLRALWLLVPFMLVFALPMGMLTAALLVFGRFSADQELTAVRSSGVSLVALITPILCLSLLLCGLSAWINMEVGPRSRVACKHLMFEMSLKASGTLLPAGRAIRDFKPYTIFAGKSEGNLLEDVHVWQANTNGETILRATAPNGSVIVQDQKIVLQLRGVRLLQGSPDDPKMAEQSVWTSYPLESPGKNRVEGATSLSDMTFWELLEELKRIENLPNDPIGRGLPSDQVRKKLREMQAQRSDMTTPVRVQIHRQIAFSFACFGFTLVGIPLGIRAHRRETNVGIAMALALVLVYYSFIILGQSLQTHAELAPYLIVWVPNFIFQTVGAVMLWRANKGI